MKKQSVVASVLGTALLSASIVGISAVALATPDHSKPAVCHPVEGLGETKTGWNIIPPDEASSHIDEALYPDGHYWKHETKDGRHDVYAVDGLCPGQQPSQSPTPTPTVTPSETPSHTPSETPSHTPSETPSETPSHTPSETPSTPPTSPPTSTPPGDLIPGDILAKCVGNIPYLAYDLTLPEGFTTSDPTPVTITFVNPSGADFVRTGLPLSGQMLWPGANVNPPMWPGWTEDGTQETDDPSRFGWTRNGVQVIFEVNPTFTTTVNYPPASAVCANPPQKHTPPGPGQPTTHQHEKCLGDALVITKEKWNGTEWVVVSTSTINGAKQCKPAPGAPPIKEEGF